MRFTTYISVSILAAAAMVNGDCQGSGESWGGDRFKALEEAQRLCGDGSLGETNYAENQFKHFCVNISSNKKADFAILVGSPLVRDIRLNKDLCVKYIQNEINGCGQGGRSTHELKITNDSLQDGEVLDTPTVDVDFSADPNAGQC
ncbi:hypothetical protein FDECE_18216 [Fusarium decemcellulare]|nr:hypothetical protein FDECE_18216 [Fusarium decemcellulare]